jgi:hypothetical protein
MEENMDKSQVSDGFHTFSELYNHRNILFIALCRKIHTWGLDKITDDENIGIWKTRFDFENKYCGDGWFIMGIGTKKGEQVSYHLSYELWDKCSFAKTMEKVPAFDGHDSKEVLSRLLKYHIG